VTPETASVSATPPIQPPADPIAKLFAELKAKIQAARSKDDLSPIRMHNMRTPGYLGPERCAHVARGAVVLLAPAASNYISGTVLTVGGGWMGR